MLDIGVLFVDNWEWSWVFTVCLYSVMIYIFRYALATLILRPIGKRLIKKSDKAEERIEIKKFVDNSWYSVYYPFISIMAYYVFNEEDFYLMNIPFVYPDDFPSITADLARNPAMLQYVMIQTAFYLQALIAMIAWEVRIDDFKQMVAHHFTTIALLFISLSCGYLRIGAMIVYCHDFTDLFLYPAKVFHYLEGAWRGFEVMSQILFVGFVGSFYYLRLYRFPISIYDCTKGVLGHSSDYPYLTAALNEYVIKYDSAISSYLVHFSERGLCVLGGCANIHTLGVCLLLVLQCLHIFWGYLTARVVYRMFSGHYEDPREESAKTKKKNH